MEAHNKSQNKPVKSKGQFKKSKEDRQQQRQFTPRKRVSECEDDGTCDLCALPIEIYAIGHCDHPICYRCSAKMRILCEQTHCAVCRVEMKKIIYCKTKMKFQAASALKLAKPDKSNNWFTDEEVKKKYKKLFQHRCRLCPDLDPEFTFDLLQVHVRKTHQLFFCDICVKYNKNFTEEYKTYTRETLARHRRIGDEDDTSHRGHPICEYCDQRYLDNDSLLRHLRLDHYFCHFCDQLGSNQYYGEYKDLRVHFRKAHFLCEIDDCVDEQFTTVFPTELDLKAHRAAVHSKNLNKQQQRADRNIDLGFQYARPPGRGGRGRGISSDDYSNLGKGRGRGRGMKFEDHDLELAKVLSLQEISNKDSNRNGRPTVERPQPRAKQSESRTESPSLPNLAEDFPGLRVSADNPSPPVTGGAYLADVASESQAVTSVASGATAAATKFATAVGRSTGSFSNEEDFPSLGSSKVGSRMTGVWGGTPLAGSQGTGSRPKTKKKSSMPVSVNVPQPIVSSRSRIDVKDNEQFPSLGRGANPPSGSSLGWMQMSATHPKKTHDVPKAKVSFSSQEPIRNTNQTKSTKAKTTAGNSDYIIKDEIISIKQGSGKHGMQIATLKQSEEISDIERPVELLAGAGSMSIKTVDPTTFSLLSGRGTNHASSKSGFDHFSAEGDEFPELGGGARKNGRIKGFGKSKMEGPAFQPNSKHDSLQDKKKTTLSLAEISHNIFPSSKVESIGVSETTKKKNAQQQKVKEIQKSTFTAPTESNLTESKKSVSDKQPKASFDADDFPCLGKAHSNETIIKPNWHEEEPLPKVADMVIEQSKFYMEENEFPSLSGSSNATRNQPKKGKKKKKNKNAQSATEVSKHFKGGFVDTAQTGGLPENGHLAALLRDASTANSLSSILQKHNGYADNEDTFSNVAQVDGQFYTESSNTEDTNHDVYISLMDQKPSKKDINGRNVWLFNAIELLCGTEEKYSDFKTASANYRRNTISGNEYYKKCRTLLGTKYFSEVFTELVDLLPDKDKQDELTKIHVT